METLDCTNSRRRAFARNVDFSFIVSGSERVFTFHRAVAGALIGGCIFIYSGSARLVCFEIKLISKEVSQAEPEYMNIHPLN